MKQARERVGLDRTLLCAIRFYAKADRSHAFDPSKRWPRGATPPADKGKVKKLLRKQGFGSRDIDLAITYLKRKGFVETGTRSVALTSRGGRVGCATVSLGPYTEAMTYGSTLKGVRRR